MDRWKIIWSLGFLFVFLHLNVGAQTSGVKESKDEFSTFVQSESKCSSCTHAKACTIESEPDNKPVRSLLWPIPFLIIAGGLFAYKRLTSRKFFLFIGILLSLFSVQLIYSYSDANPNNNDTGPTKNNPLNSPNIVDNSDEFVPFVEDSKSNIAQDDFTSFNEGGKDDKDEFAPFTETASTDEFSSFEPEKVNNAIIHDSSEEKTITSKEKESQNYLLRYVGLILLITVVAGFLSRFKTTRRFRLIFLLSSLIYMGFYNGGCPCMISSFQDFVMWMFGAEVFWGTMLWFLGLMVITYFFGRVWCGWFCHLGALQEFLYKAAIFKPLKSARAQLVFKIMRNVTLLVLLVQIAITNTNIFIHYDPFKVAFNLFSANTTGYILLFIMLISSLLINRPFCRGFCPVGLVMGWVSRIPGASILHPSNECIACKSCNNACEVGAIVREEKISTLDNAECIRCGACQDNCAKNAMAIKSSNGQIDFTCVKPDL